MVRAYGSGCPCFQEVETSLLIGLLSNRTPYTNRHPAPAADSARPAMRTIANLPAEAAQALLARLTQEGIPAQILSCVDDNGVDSSEIVVEDADHDRACDVADAWDTERVAEAEKRATRRCPKCRSPRLEYVPHEKLEYICRCAECGAEFVI